MPWPHSSTAAVPEIRKRIIQAPDERSLSNGVFVRATGRRPQRKGAGREGEGGGAGEGGPAGARTAWIGCLAFHAPEVVRSAEAARAVAVAPFRAARPPGRNSSSLAEEERALRRPPAVAPPAAAALPLRRQCWPAASRKLFLSYWQATYSDHRATARGWKATVISQCCRCLLVNVNVYRSPPIANVSPWPGCST